ncbi:MAG: methyltransferase [Pirellulales bacterium]|nr:methyltransferase [Pirellulales bacterium]
MEHPPDRLQPRPAEARVLAAARQLPGRRILCTSLGRAQAATALAAERPEATVACWFLDEHQLRLALRAAPANPRLSLVCQADLPPGPVDLAVFPFSRRGEAELTRDLLQGACERLTTGGALVAAVDNPQDQWLAVQLKELFGKVTVRRMAEATVYIARKRAEPRRYREFRCPFAFRDRGRLLQAESRPGVFAHRRVDPGARQLLAAADVAPQMRVLEIGCGSGTVALALAAREPSAAVHAVDSNARAVECTLAGAALNGLTNVTAELNSTGEYGAAGSYDLALANPPYYADFRIAELFLAAAHRSLRRGGRVLAVTKRPAWYEQTMASAWRDVRCWASKQYYLASAVRP